MGSIITVSLIAQFHLGERRLVWCSLLSKECSISVAVMICHRNHSINILKELDYELCLY